jgi:transposase
LREAGVFGWRDMRILMMSKRNGGRGFKYEDAFKRQLVAESSAVGVSVPMVSKHHGVPTNQIYAWRSDARFQADGGEVGEFSPVELVDGDIPDVPAPLPSTMPEPRPAFHIEITLENGRKLSVSDGVDAGFVLELARGLAA